MFNRKKRDCAQNLDKNTLFSISRSNDIPVCNYQLIKFISNTKKIYRMAKQYVPNLLENIQLSIPGILTIC